MKLYEDMFYQSAIKSAYPDCWDIRKPIVSGETSPVFLCDTMDGILVCRFSDSNIILRNCLASKLLEMYDIPVPQTRVRKYQNVWFETYKYCPAPTLYERIKGGMSSNEIFDVYKDVIRVQRTISNVPINEFKPLHGRYAYNIYIATKKMRIPSALSYTFGTMHRLFSGYGRMRLLHNDLQSKNILVDDNGRVAHLIDLDAVSLCNENFSVMLTLRSYPLNNYSEFMDYYEYTMERKLNRRAIMTGLAILKKTRKSQIKLNNMLGRGYNKLPLQR